MFSHYLKYIIQNLHFASVVITRFFKVLFRRRKGIQLLYLDYAAEHLFDNSNILINYRFANALYYKFGNHKTLEKQLKIFNLKNFEKEFDLIVYGFFRKKIYRLKFEPQLQFDNANFKTSFRNLNLKLREQPVIVPKKGFIRLNIKKPLTEIPEIQIQRRQIRLKTNNYNQNEYI